MSDQAADHFEQQQAAAPGAPQGKSVTLTVTLHPNGSLDFQLPASNKILAYGLLEVARAQLDKMYLMQEVGQAKNHNGGIDGLLKRMGRS